MEQENPWGIYQCAMATFEAMEASQQSVSKRQRQTRTKPKQDRLPQSMLGFPYFHRADHTLLYTRWLTVLKSMFKRDPENTLSVPSVSRSRRILETVADTNQQLPSHGPCNSHIQVFFWAVNLSQSKIASLVRYIVTFKINIKGFWGSKFLETSAVWSWNRPQWSHWKAMNTWLEYYKCVS